jgi:phytanoyl-CoA hydroxylase
MIQKLKQKLKHIFSTEKKSVIQDSIELGTEIKRDPQDYRIESPLAIDAEDYERQIKSKVLDGKINEEEGRQLLSFAENGYSILDLEEPDSLFDQFQSEVEAVWQDAPSDLLGASEKVTKGKLWPISDLVNTAEGQRIRVPGSRIIDLHSHSDAARRLYLNPKVHKLISLILEQECIATQSLYFEYGSTQALHRDPWFVVTKPVHNLFACWIALEDIHLDSGPLTYVPQSHQIPFLRDYKDNIILHAPHVDQSFKQAVYKHMKEQVGEAAIEPKVFTAKKGQAFIWHGSLVHGGSPIVNEELTRNSFVVHFDAKETAPRRGARFVRDDQEHVLYTDALYEEDGCFGYKSPLEA